MSDIVELANRLLTAQLMKNTSDAGLIGNALYNEVCLDHQGTEPLLNLPLSECRNVGMAYTIVALCYNWGDIDMNSVASENAYYCLARSIIEQNDLYAAPAIFSILLKWPELLKDKLIEGWCTMEQLKWRTPINC